MMEDGFSMQEAIASFLMDSSWYFFEEQHPTQAHPPERGCVLGVSFEVELARGLME